MKWSNHFKNSSLSIHPLGEVAKIVCGGAPSIIWDNRLQGNIIIGGMTCPDASTVCVRPLSPDVRKHPSTSFLCQNLCGLVNTWYYGLIIIEDAPRFIQQIQFHNSSRQFSKIITDDFTICLSSSSTRQTFSLSIHFTWVSSSETLKPITASSFTYKRIGDLLYLRHLERKSLHIISPKAKSHLPSG